jgi:hypothetical protein
MTRFYLQTYDIPREIRAIGASFRGKRPEKRPRSAAKSIAERRLRAENRRFHADPSRLRAPQRPIKRSAAFALRTSSRGVSGVKV